MLILLPFVLVHLIPSSGSHVAIVPLSRDIQGFAIRQGLSYGQNGLKGHPCSLLHLCWHQIVENFEFSMGAQTTWNPRSCPSENLFHEGLILQFDPVPLRFAFSGRCCSRMGSRDSVGWAGNGRNDQIVVYKQHVIEFFATHYV